MRVSIFICSLLLVAVPPAVLSAQEGGTPDRPVGERPKVRLQYADSGQRRVIAGRLVSLTTDSVEVVDAYRTHWRLPLDRVSDLKTSSHRSVNGFRILRSGFITGAVGAGLGALIGGGGMGSAYGAIFYGAGLVVGVIAGALPTDRWDRVAIPPHSPVAMMERTDVPIVRVRF